LLAPPPSTLIVQDVPATVPLKVIVPSLACAAAGIAPSVASVAVPIKLIASFFIFKSSITMEIYQ
jgi:hypothetical protein